MLTFYIVDVEPAKHT